jgi:hypothetical protein
MSDRADYLARTLIARLARLQSNSTEDGRAEPDRQRRIEVIEKVLAVELGLTDGPTLASIEATVPRVKSGERAPDREQAAFAAFLRQRLASHLAES